MMGVSVTQIDPQHAHDCDLTAQTCLQWLQHIFLEGVMNPVEPDHGCVHAAEQTV